MENSKFYIGKKEKIKEYWQTEKVSQSLLKAGLRDFRAYYTPQELSETPSIILGSLVDILLTSQEPNKDVEDTFVQTDLYDVVASPKEQEVIKAIFNNTDKETLEDVDKKLIIDVIDNLKWQTNWKTETRVKKIIEKGSTYFKLLKDTILEDGAHKKSITTEILNKALILSSEMEEQLKKFILKISEYLVEVKIYYQVPLYSKIEGIECKGLLDVVVIGYNTVTKDIMIFAIDYKTTFGNNVVSDFARASSLFCYDLQSAFYSQLIKENYQLLKDLYLSTTEKLKDIIEKVSNIKFDSFSFIVGSTGEMPQAVRIKADSGFITSGKNKYQEALVEYTYYMENQNGKSKDLIEYEEGERELIINEDFEIV